MFTPQIQKNGMLHILKQYVYYRNKEKTSMLYILKLVCLLQKYGKNGYVVNIKTSMFTTEIQKNGMLHILKLVCLLQK